MRRYVEAHGLCCGSFWPGCALDGMHAGALLTRLMRSRRTNNEVCAAPAARMEVERVGVQGAVEDDAAPPAEEAGVQVRALARVMDPPQRVPAQPQAATARAVAHIQSVQMEVGSLFPVSATHTCEGCAR